ncbi:MAG: lipopolysaccharide transport periplasmic protein LptA [Chromatiales bacterium]|jgi:lipopolysaccharide export system protein LptA
MSLNPLITSCTALLLCLLSWQAVALSTDKDQPVSIEADSVDINEADQLAIYRGKVIVIQGSIRINASKVVVHDFQSDSAYLVATGDLVKFRQTADDQQQIKGAGKQVEYALNDAELILTGDAELIKGQYVSKSDRIIYDREKALVKAGASAAGKERVKITIGPKAK